MHRWAALLAELALWTAAPAAATGAFDTIAPLCKVYPPVSASAAEGQPQGLECRPQSWGEADSGIINATLVGLGQACSPLSTALPHGSIALVERGVCPFAVKADTAVAAGAMGLVFWDPGPTDDEEAPMVTTGDRVQLPLVTVGRRAGAELSAALQTMDNNAQTTVSGAEHEGLKFTIVFNPKWSIEKAEDRWRKVVKGTVGTEPAALLAHGATLAQLGRDGEAMREFRAAIAIAARGAGDAGAGTETEAYAELQAIGADAKFNLRILEAKWRNESLQVWDDFVARRCPDALKRRFDAAMAMAEAGAGAGGGEALAEMEAIARTAQDEFGLDLQVLPGWLEVGGNPFVGSDRYGDGLAELYDCQCETDDDSSSAEAEVGSEGHPPCRMHIAVETWRFLSASYAVVGVNTLMELLALRDEGICVSVLNPPLYEGGWKHIDGLYPPEIEAALKAIPSSRGDGADGEVDCCAVRSNQHPRTPHSPATNVPTPLPSYMAPRHCQDMGFVGSGGGAPISCFGCTFRSIWTLFLALTRRPLCLAPPSSPSAPIARSSGLWSGPMLTRRLHS